MKKLTACNSQVFYACLNREVYSASEYLNGRSLYLQETPADT